MEFFQRGFLGVIATNINDHLSNIPPYRLTSYTSESKAFLNLSSQHLLFDGITLSVLLSDPILMHPSLRVHLRALSSTTSLRLT